MEDILFFEQNLKNDFIFICKKCLENKEYSIPLYRKNRETYNMEYICSKSHTTGKNDIQQIKYDNKLNALLGKCQCLFHNNNPFCGWCEECKKNLCFLLYFRRITT